MTNRHQINTNEPRIAARLSQVLRDILAGLDALHRIQFDRPWERVVEQPETCTPRGIASH